MDTEILFAAIIVGIFLFIIMTVYLSRAVRLQSPSPKHALVEGKILMFSRKKNARVAPAEGANVEKEFKVRKAMTMFRVGGPKHRGGKDVFLPRG